MSLTLIRNNADYRWLVDASGVSNVGDGVSALAFPRLATLITRDPVLIALFAVAGRLPRFLFTLPAGVWTDRLDRRRLMVRADVFRMVETLGVVAMVLGVINACAMAVLTMLVPFSLDVLGLGVLGYSLLLTCGAVGRVLGGVLAPAVARRMGSTRSHCIAFVIFVG